MKIGIMQGRLVPPEAGRIQAFPRARWTDEFALARSAGFDTIEWIYDEYGRDVNPIGNDAGIASMQELQSAAGVDVRSVVADYFMDFPLVGSGGPECDRVDSLCWLLERSRRLRISRVVLPFVDASSMRTEKDQAEVRSVLNETLAVAKSAGVELHLETDLGPAAFARFIAPIAHSHLRINYDSGNSASLGYDVREEFAAYGQTIGSVHIKDRVRDGGTVPLGSGSVDFVAVFEQLEAIDYDGDLVLQVARGLQGDEVELAKANIAFVSRHLLGTASA